jgi:hypothetical protein
MPLNQPFVPDSGCWIITALENENEKDAVHMVGK